MSVAVSRGAQLALLPALTPDQFLEGRNVDFHLKRFAVDFQEKEKLHVRYNQEERKAIFDAFSAVLNKETAYRVKERELIKEAGGDEHIVQGIKERCDTLFKIVFLRDAFEKNEDVQAIVKKCRLLEGQIEKETKKFADILYSLFWSWDTKGALRKYFIFSQGPHNRVLRRRQEALADFDTFFKSEQRALERQSEETPGQYQTDFNRQVYRIGNKDFCGMGLKDMDQAAFGRIVAKSNRAFARLIRSCMSVEEFKGVAEEELERLIRKIRTQIQLIFHQGLLADVAIQQILTYEKEGFMPITDHFDMTASEGSLVKGSSFNGERSAFKDAYLLRTNRVQKVGEHTLVLLATDPKRIIRSNDSEKKTVGYDGLQMEVQIDFAKMTKKDLFLTQGCVRVIKRRMGFSTRRYE